MPVSFMKIAVIVILLRRFYSLKAIGLDQRAFLKPINNDQLKQATKTFFMY